MAISTWAIIEPLGFRLKSLKGQQLEQFEPNREQAEKSLGGCGTTFFVSCICDPDKGGCGAKKAIDKVALQQAKTAECKNCLRKPGSLPCGTVAEKLRWVYEAMDRIRERGEFFTLKSLAREAQVATVFFYKQKVLWADVKATQLEMAELNGMVNFEEFDRQRREKIRASRHNRKNNYERRPDRKAAFRGGEERFSTIVSAALKPMNWDEWSDGREFDQTG